MFEKKILVCKQVSEGFSVGEKLVSGIFRIENENGITSFSLSLINVAPANKGQFYLFILEQNKNLYTFELGKAPQSITKILPSPLKSCEGVAVGVSFIDENLPTLVVFASDNNKINVNDFKKAVFDKCLLDFKQKEKTAKLKEEKRATQTNESSKETLLDKYDDEVVATENYFEFEKNENYILSELNNGNCVRNENGGFNCERQTKTEEEFSKNFDIEDETDLFSSPSYDESNPYYYTAKQELDAIFIKFPPELALSRLVPESTWAKINYAKDKYYVVGLVKCDGVEKYICYGVPAKYSSTPPKQLEGYCSFIPLSVFDTTGDGYWMMFQSAITGECVKLNEKN